MKRDNKNTIFFNLFLTYFLLFMMIFVTFSAALLKQMYDKNKALYQKEQQSHIERLSRILDERFMDIEQIGLQLSNMDWVKKVRSQSEIITRNIDVLRRQEICHEMNTYQAIIRISKGIVLLLPHKDLAIDSVSFWEQERYLNSIGLKNNDVKKWIKNLSDNISPLFLVNPDNRDTNRLIVLKQIDYLNSPELVLFVPIDGQVFSDLIQQKYDENIFHFEIRMKDKTLFASKPKQESNTDIYAQTVSSSLFEWDYYFEIIPTQNYKGVPLMIWFTLLAADLVISIAIAFLLSKISYSPIRGLLKKLGVKSNKISSEFAEIENVFLNLREEKQSFELLSRQYFDAAKNNFVIILLNGLFYDALTVDTLQEYGFNLYENESYMVTLLEYQERLPKEEHLLHYVKLQAVFQKNFDMVYFSELSDQRCVLIINCKDSSLYVQYKNKIQALVNEVTSGLLDAYCGFIYKGIIGVSKSYQDAKEHQKGDASSEITPYYYPDDWKVQLIDGLLDRNKEVVYRILFELKQENMRRHIILSETQTVTGLIMDIIFKMSHASAKMQEVILKDYVRIKDISALWDYLQIVADKTCFDSVIKADTSAELGTQIVQYVFQNIDNRNISQLSIAAEFGIPRSTLSKLFKKTAGVNFIDYIQNKRVEKARTIIDGGVSDILEVAKLVGYDNEITFKRAFMCVEGITPRKYIQKVQSLRN